MVEVLSPCFQHRPKQLERQSKNDFASVHRPMQMFATNVKYGAVGNFN